MTHRTHKTTAAFLIFNFTFLIASLSAFPARAQTVGPYCFRAQECAGAPYNGIPSGCGSREDFESTNGACAKEASECSAQIQGQAAYSQAYRYNCFTTPPSVRLQVSIGGKYAVAGIEGFILQIYNYLVGIAAIVAGIMIVFAGFKWLTSGGNPERITDARKKIGNAIVGMALVFGSYLILQTINPALVRLRTPPIKMARKEFAPQETNCVPRPEFRCGQPYNCSDPQYLGNPPCGARGSGTCIGQTCANSAEVCARPITQRATESTRQFQPTARVCVNPSVCSNCSTVRDVETCVSDACNCVLVRNNAGQNVCSSPLADGRDCNNDIQCASGNCNTVWRYLQGLTGQCGRVGNGQNCSENNDCLSRLCNRANGPRCVTPASLADGEDCSESAMCRSGRCGYNRSGVIGFDPVCGGSILVEILGGY